MGRAFQEEVALACVPEIHPAMDASAHVPEGTVPVDAGMVAAGGMGCTGALARSNDAGHCFPYRLMTAGSGKGATASILQKMRQFQGCDETAPHGEFI